MHSAPAVGFPVGRSHFQGLLIGASIACGISAVSVWCFQADALGWRQLLAGVLCLVMPMLATWQWLLTPIGRLSWDGAAWHWTVGEQSVVVMPELVLDLQQAMLLRLRVTEDASVTWAWLDRAFSPPRWMAFRRAIYTRLRHLDDSSVEPAGASEGLTRSVI